MNISFYTYTNEKNAINKTLTQLASLTGDLRSECDILKPVIIIEIDGSDLTQTEILKSANYAYIQDFGRYYFITGIKGIGKNLVEISLAVDVLYSWKNEILAQSCIIARQEKSNYACLHLSDNYIRTYNDPYHVTKTFPSGFTAQTVILTVAGSST